MPHLDENCYNGDVSAVRYCYQYEPTSASDAVFNLTVLVLNGDLIVNSFTITTRPVSGHAGETCYNIPQDPQKKRICCDVTHLSPAFNLPKKNFTFGVTVSSQGNTNNATLLGFHDSLPKYLVETILFPRADKELRIGSRLQTENKQPMTVGVRCLWFIIGKLT